MSDYEVIDAHMHTFHTPEAGRQAMSQLESRTDYSGTMEEALEALRKAGIPQGLMLATIPLAYMREAAQAKLPEGLSDGQRQEAEDGIKKMLLERLARRNLWMCRVSQEHPNMFPTITLDPMMGAQAMRQEIRDKVTSYGVKALKLHPPIGRFYPYDRDLWPAYETAVELDVPLIFHCGLLPDPERPDQPVEYCRPEYFKEALSSFPKLRLVLAHMGVGVEEKFLQFYQPYYDAALALAREYPTVCFDLSATMDLAMTPEDLERMIHHIGAQRVLFGSDFPWFDPTLNLERVLRLDLSQEERRLILAENARRVYKLV